jgi:hypothetical protein
MPKISTYGDAISDLIRLLAAAEENANQLPDITVIKFELGTVLSIAQDAKRRQDHHVSERQSATQELRNALDRGHDAAIQLRSAARLAFGARNEKLVQFRVAPLRKRKAPKNLLLKPPVTELTATPAATPDVTVDKP